MIKLLFIAFFAAVVVCLFGVSIYGLILAFSANVILGILTLFVEPAPFIFGIAMIFGGANLPEKIMHWYHSDSIKVSVEVHQ